MSLASAAGKKDKKYDDDDYKSYGGLLRVTKTADAATRQAAWLGVTCLC